MRTGTDSNHPILAGSASPAAPAPALPRPQQASQPARLTGTSITRHPQQLYSTQHTTDPFGTPLPTNTPAPAPTPAHTHKRTGHPGACPSQAVFKEVVPIGSASVRAKIHQSYRLGYVKDVVLPRVLDDATFATLSSLILFNNVEVRLSSGRAGSWGQRRLELRSACSSRRDARAGLSRDAA